MLALTVAFAAAPTARLAIEALRPPGKRLSFGAVVRGLDLVESPPTEDELALLEEALSEHGLLVFEGAAPPELEPGRFVDLVRRLNPGSAETVWRDQRTNPWERFKAAHMGPAGTFQLPDCPEVLVLGTGEVVDHFGLSAVLGGKRAAYGKDTGSQVIGGGALQWHIDGAIWAAPSSGRGLVGSELRAPVGLPCSPRRAALAERALPSPRAR
jgi:hypothetical protein